jgi:hypothetical protein
MDPFGAERGGQCLRAGVLRPRTSVPSWSEVQGYQRHLGLKLALQWKSMLVAVAGDLELKHSTKLLPMPPATVANSMDAPMKGTGSIGDGDTQHWPIRAYRWTASSGEHQRPDDMTAETTTPCRSLFRIGRHLSLFSRESSTQR